jgi:hypothetical protein
MTHLTDTLNKLAIIKGVGNLQLRMLVYKILVPSASLLFRNRFRLYKEEFFIKMKGDDGR